MEKLTALLLARYGVRSHCPAAAATHPTPAASKGCGSSALLPLTLLLAATSLPRPTAGDNAEPPVVKQKIAFHIMLMSSATHLPDVVRTPSRLLPRSWA